MANLYVYGTLLFPDLLFALTGKYFETKDVPLNGYKRCRVYDNNIPRSYPAITEDEGSTVYGKIILNVDNESLNILDFYEEDDYIRKEININCDNSVIRVFIYIWNPIFNHKLKHYWNEKEFESNHLELYIKKIVPQLLIDYQNKK